MTINTVIYISMKKYIIFSKDMMVLQALQNGNNRQIHNRNKFQKGVHNTKKSGNVEKSQSDPNKNAKSDVMQKNVDPKNER